ncbi:hypothetical protein XHV734_p0053 (plasmid) [Xanthomonas hortorum pv. vitians]|nr:hypothetical protein XHV734_p0053 [Xanthomonas hortorum pv. vitians]
MREGTAAAALQCVWFPYFARAQRRWEGRSPSIELLTLSASHSGGDADLLLSALLTVLSTKG